MNIRAGTAPEAGWIQRFSAWRELSVPASGARAGSRDLRVLQITNMYPSADRPNWGVFVGSQVESLASCGVSSEVIDIEGWRARSNYLRALLCLPLRVRAADYDLVHVHFGWSLLACAGLRGLPLVVSFCGSDYWGHVGEGGRLNRASQTMALLSRHAARRAQAIIVKSPDMASGFGLADARVEVIANGLDFDVFEPGPAAQARQQLGWPADREILLFPADPQEARKNFELARAVEARLLAQGRPVTLIWRYGVPQSEIVLAMRAADVMLSCSYQEGSPNTVKEAMAMNLPVVATSVGDCAARLRGCHPSAVAGFDVESFAAAVAEVLDAKRRSNGRSLATALNIDGTAMRLRGVYERAVERFHSGRRR